MKSLRPIGSVAIGLLRPELETAGSVERRTLVSGPALTPDDLLDQVAERFRKGRERRFPLEPKVGGRKLRLVVDRQLDRYRTGQGAAVFELLGRVLASEKAAPGLAARLSDPDDPLPVVLLDNSPALVTVGPDGSLVGLNRIALEAKGLDPFAALVAVSLAHGLRAAARLRAHEPYEPEKETVRDVKNLLLLLVGILGTEWRPEEVRETLAERLKARDPLLEPLVRYGRKLTSTVTRSSGARLDDGVFRDGARFDGLPAREKRRVILAGTLAWYGMLTLGLLRLPRRLFARRNPYYETAWWIFRAKPGGRRLFKGALIRRAGRAIRSFRPLAAFEYLWASWNPVLAETCLRPVYRYAGGNRRPFLATLATYAWTALVIHPLWVTLAITGLAWVVGLFWPWLDENTRIASRENLILHGIVIGFWMGIGFLVALSKLRKGRAPPVTGAGSPPPGSSR